jgi:FlaA1/EpsC-like NDP-sugar epimerase
MWLQTSGFFRLTIISICCFLLSSICSSLTSNMAHTLTITLGFLAVVQALPSWSNAEVKRGATDVAKEYDYIVVGAGTAGTTVADRLSEDGKRKQPPVVSDHRSKSQKLYSSSNTVAFPRTNLSCHYITLRRQNSCTT